MEGQTTPGQSPYLYQSAQWSRLVRRNTVAASSPIPSPSVFQSPQFATPIELLPTLLPSPQTYQAQLAHYNKLISSGRGARVQSSPLPPVVSTPHIQAVQQPSSPGFDNGKRTRSVSRAGHGNKNAHNNTNGERPLIAAEGSPARMSTKKMAGSKQPSPRPSIPPQNSSLAHHSSSVPTTPHQHARQFSLDSRDPSPNAPQNHSPRSAYSETNSTLPSLRPLPPRSTGCQYETAMTHSRRRMPYNMGADKLEKVKPSSLKAHLTEDEERKLTGDMRELYDRLLPKPESDLKRQKFVQKLEKLLNTEWPGHDIRVHVFGSSGNLLCTDESDVDICITTEWKELEAVCKLADLLARHGMEKVICVSTAKVPIVKIWDPELKLACDMNVNNTLALENTRMIKTYVQIDERVRPLAMIIKHWTKRRIVNDAAFGGTLSSYTWICMIINFLQMREPPVVPALHQRPHLKLPVKGGQPSSFADDVDALRGFGDANKETLGELLFHFFRFYGHELDYEKWVLSVRNGKLISKVEKNWHHAVNNRLCVEEPFNLTRNLGNTADDTSFRGLHLELRRAFDLISEAKLDVACEQYVFPKEEERIWEKPPPQPRPVLSRSASQSRGGRGGRGGRHNNQNRNPNSGRRASSSTFDKSSNYLPHVMTTNEAWLQTAAAQSQLHNDLYTTFSVLQAQENNLRMQLLSQSQAYAQAQAQAYAQAQRLNGTMNQQQATDRTRGSSFDNPPLSAPLRPDMYFWAPMQYPPPAPSFGHASPSTYPSSPSISPALPELRRTLHRSTNASAGGTANEASGSSLRSQSQPATRTAASPLAFQSVGASANDLQTQQSRQGIPIPNFIADESGDSGFETESATTLPESPPDDVMPKEYVGYYVNHNPRRGSYTPSGLPIFGDLDLRRRRQSAEQFPAAVFERINRASRSPSPLGRERTYSSGINSAPISVAPFQYGMPNHLIRPYKEHAPLIVNGSTALSPSDVPLRHASAVPSLVSDDPSSDTLAEPVDPVQLSPSKATDQNARADSIGLGVTMYPLDLEKLNEPIIVNGSGGAPEPKQPLLESTNRKVSPVPHITTKGLNSLEQSNDSAKTSPERTARPPLSGAMSPLDIGPLQTELLRDELPHLSPVYEVRTPSPTINRKFEPVLEDDKNGILPQSAGSDTSTRTLKLAVVNNLQKNSGPSSSASRGHTRGAKSEGGNTAGAWQKIPKHKKKGQSSEQKSSPNDTQSHGEQIPKKESDRKGG